MNYYETFIGQITVWEFIGPFSNDIDKAIENVIENWPWDCEIPGDFESVVSQYCLDTLDQGG